MHVRECSRQLRAAPALASSAGAIIQPLRECGCSRADAQRDACSDDITALERIVDALVIAFSDHFDLRLPNVSSSPTRSAQVGVRKLAVVAQPAERPNGRFTRGHGGGREARQRVRKGRGDH